MLWRLFALYAFLQVHQIVRQLCVINVEFHLEVILVEVLHEVLEVLYQALHDLLVMVIKLEV
jgi:hypothetical protein